jgi:hypothetical protein
LLSSKGRKKWGASLFNRNTGTVDALGCFDNEEDAARAADACVP